MNAKTCEKTFRQKLEDNPLWVVAVFTIAGFGAGIGASEWKKQTSASVDNLDPMVWGMNLDYVVDDKTTAAWEGIVQQLSPIVVGGRRLVPWTVEMVRGTKTSEGEWVIYWRQIPGSDKFTLDIVGSYRERLPIPDGGTIELAWGPAERQISNTRGPRSKKQERSTCGSCRLAAMRGCRSS